MIYSMTAFARESSLHDFGRLTMELRSVNHRYLDCTFKLPEELRAAEAGFRELAAAAMARGKLDCAVRLQPASSPQGAPLTLDRERLQAVLDAAAQISAQAPHTSALNPLELLQFPGVCSPPQGNEESLLKSARTLFESALDTLLANRAREGKQLERLIRERLVLLSHEVAKLREQVPSLLLQQRQRLVERIAELELDVDSARLEQELVFMAQKADVDEELDRLDAHLEEIERTLHKGSPCGRRLDFLMQELNREANTLSSKSTAATTTQHAVELKVLIEQMREQVQNIE